MTTAPKGQAETTAVYFVYDGWNRVAGISSTASHDGDFVDAGEVQYLYDGTGRRIQKIFAGTATADQDVYFNEDFQALETRWNGSTNAYEQHVWDLKYIDAPILRYRDANGLTSSTSTGDGTAEEVLYFTFDANFNITGLVQENQTFVERYVYTPFGDRLVLTGTFGSRASTNYDQQLGHQGLYTDVESGTIYNRGRQGYHPGLGNFTQRDPRLTEYQDGLNLYQGYRGNPVMGVDPSGLHNVLLKVFIVQSRLKLILTGMEFWMVFYSPSGFRVELASDGRQEHPWSQVKRNKTLLVGTGQGLLFKRLLMCQAQ